ncbi:MAG: D-alanyl-D-alanine carboxypeptidase [Neomegalonema sp.]|nr:D-alanyl-D-alanine carboxypeptidase [Neomegalonema sp.]
MKQSRIKRRIFARRAILALVAIVLSAAALLGAPNDALAKPKPAYAIMDADTGKFIKGVRSSERAYPASLTKMMTLYLVFEALEDGKLSLDQKLKASRNAENQPPSELGLKRGDRITVSDAIRAAAVKSANDAAVVLAEAIGGTEANFAKMMTKKAKALGMKRTTFKNATGLTARGHLSTPRDMAVLARRVWADFPQHYRVFARKSAQVHGRRLRATNNLLSDYEGADGVKTGYTSAAGFNLAASAVKNERRAIVVYFGAKSVAKRDKRVAELLDLAFKKLPKLKKTYRPSGLVAYAPLPSLRPKEGERETLRAVASDLPDITAEPAPEQPQIASARAPKKAPSAARPLSRRGNNAPGDVRTGEIARSNSGANWAIQVGAYFDRVSADRQLSRILKSHAPALKNAYRSVSTYVNGRKMIFRARFIRMAESDARSTCSYLTGKRLDCTLVPPSSW